MSEPRLQVMFSPSAAATLRQALRSADRADEVWCPFDDFSFGPIATDDPETRVRWVEEELGYTGWDEITDKSAVFLAAFEAPTAPLTVWLSRRETKIYAGFLWWLSHVGDMPASVIEVAELSITSPNDMLKIIDQAVPLSAENRAFYRAQWVQLKSENSALRVIDGDNLVSAPIEYFDGKLLSHATHDWQKMARIVGRLLVQFWDAGVSQTDDLVLGARLADLAEAGELEWQGDLSEMRFCEVRLPAN